MHVIAGKAVAFAEAATSEFAADQRQTMDNARAMAKMFRTRGFNIVSDGTDDHLFLVDFIKSGLTGKDAEAALSRANITVNKNAVPNDPQSPFVTLGIRVGTAAATTRGSSADGMPAVGRLDVRRSERDRRRTGRASGTSAGAGSVRQASRFWHVERSARGG